MAGSIPAGNCLQQSSDKREQNGQATVTETEKATLDSTGKMLHDSKLVGVLEIVIVFGAAALVIFLGLPLVGEDLFAKQLVIFAANLVMLTLVWLGLRLRGQGAAYLGLSVCWRGWKSLATGFAKSLLVLVLAMAGFMLGSIVMANITGIPQQADVSGYDFLQGNLAMLLVSLAAIYFVSSFGEEVVYRGFLINRVQDLLGGGKSAVWVAVIISSLVFGLAHYGWGPVGMVQTAFMGLALALSYLLFRRQLWILVAAHAYMDTALIVPLYFG
jgi:membrane protease YdiL (CAAX protease family)